MGDTNSGAVDAGGNLRSTKPVRVDVRNETPASGRVVSVMTDYKIQAAKLFPELQGQIYAHFNQLTQGNLTNNSVLGYYSEAEKKIVIANGVARGGEKKLRETMAHEMAHAFSINTPRGFRSYGSAFDRAFKEYKKSHKRATQSSFAGSISNYAKSAKAEAFAEAFRDYTMNGKNAKAASKLIIKHWRR